MIVELSAIANAFQDVARIFKTAKELLPDSEQKADIAQKLEVAERSLALAEANAANALGYELCRCAFPPQIMLNVGSNRRHWRCDRCGGEIETAKSTAAFSG